VINPQGPSVPPSMMMGMPPEGPAPASEQPASADTGDTATHYLIAFKDHSIYSAVAYWVDGDTLHYFTTGSTHNQVSLSLVDRDLTRQLNAQSGLQLNLPASK
jgi:endonuclease YncB( thermonuclease family)